MKALKPGRMVVPKFKKGRLSPALLSAGLAAVLSACAAGGFNPADINVPKFQVRNLDTNPTMPSIAPLGPVPPDQFVGPDGGCAAVPAAATPGPATATPGPAAVSGGIGLGMTECDVVGRAGAPENIEVSANERGQRAVVLTYIRGARPGIYRFVSGRLTVIERAPEPPAPPKPVRAKKAKKKPRPRTTDAPPPPPANGPAPDGVWPPPR